MPVRKYQDTSSTLFWGEVCDVLTGHVAPNSVDLVVADPPYNIGKQFATTRDRWPDDASYLAWCVRWLDLCIERLTATGSLYLMASTQSMPLLDLHLRRRMHVLSRIVWHYDSSGVQARRRFGSLYEPILHCVKDPASYTFEADAIRVEAPTGARRRLIDHRKAVPAVYASDKVPGNVWYFPRVRYRSPEYESHPTQKPEALLYRVMLAASKPGDIILDPFFGTGTTGAVARRLRRRWIGIDRETKYVDAARARIASTLPLDESAMLGVPEKASQPRVAFGLLVESGTVVPGTILTDAKRRWQAEVKADGSLVCGTQGGSIHRLGSLLQDAPSCNGWTFWHVERAGHRTMLDTIRSEIRATLPESR